MVDDPFIKDFFPKVGTPEEITPGIRRLVAPNASPMTFRGTNTYLLGEAEIAVVDPGPEGAAHLENLLRAVGDPRKISHIFVTHSHLDHSPLASRLSELADAPVLALGDSLAGRSTRMAELAATVELGGGEGVDVSFNPDIHLADGELVATSEWQMTAMATPGHFSNHLCFAHSGGEVFSGDHVMSWATTLVSPPDGDLNAFMHSLAKLLDRSGDRLYLPGHGAALENPHEMVRHQLAHRKGRESQIIEALAKGPATPLDLAITIYTEIPPELIPAAARNVFSHLIDLIDKNIAEITVPLSPEARFSLTAD